MKHVNTLRNSPEQVLTLPFKNTSVLKSWWPQKVNAALNIKSKAGLCLNMLLKIAVVCASMFVTCNGVFADTSGFVVAWGYNQSGQCNVPPSALSGVTAIAAGSAHTIALKNDNTVVAWGYNQSGQCNVPPSALSGVTAIAAGSDHTIALKGSAVLAWGYNQSGQCNVPPSALSGVTAIAAGSDHTIALKNDNTVVAWGSNDYGECLGTDVNGDGIDVPTTGQLVQILGTTLINVSAIAGGSGTTIALKKNGSVVSWGYSTNLSDEARSGVTAIAMNKSHYTSSVFALKNGGVISITPNSDELVPNAAQSGVTAIEAGYDHIIALKIDGTVVAWGSNDDGECLGTDASTNPITTAATGQLVQRIGRTLDTVTAIAGGAGFTIAIKSVTPGQLVSSIAGVSPTSGPSTGATAITITGQNLMGATRVTVGGVAATSVVVVNATTITARTPAGMNGSQSVSVTTPHGTALRSSAFTYTAHSNTCANSASVYSFEYGGHSYELVKEIKRWEEAATCAVLRGGHLVHIDSLNEQTAIRNACATSGVSTSYNPIADGGGASYIWIGATDRVFEGVWMWDGYDDGSGINFWSGNQNGSAVASRFQNWGRDPNGSFQSAPDNFQPIGQHRAALALGNWTEGLAGQWNDLYVTDENYYIIEYESVLPNPTITSVSPSSGTTLGGTAFTITGTKLTGATSVTVGGVAATNVVVVNATTITAKTAAKSAGLVDVVVTTPVDSATKASAFTYVFFPVPTITSVSPSSGTTLGGTAFTITGTNLTGATSVTVGGVAATSVGVVSATSITARTPAGTAGAKSVVVTTNGGTATKASAFTYVIPLPTITLISPSSGTTLGGTAFMITGTNLTGTTSVTVGGVAATSVVVESPTSITAVTPALTAGAKSVTVTTAGGTATKLNAFTFVIPAPTITSVSPSSGTTLGGTAFTITGANLTGATSVTVGGAAATNVVVTSSASLTAKTPAGTAGAKSVAVTTAGGTATKSSAFTYAFISVPTITSVSPSSGTTLGGTAFTITGSNLTGATSVKVNGVAATSVVVVSATSITARTPAGTAGAKSVAVTTGGGTATKASAFTYIAAPTITSISPTSGPTSGNTAITITGTNFTGVTSVKVNGVAATSVVVVSATSITARTPAGTAGAKSVAVTNVGGTATKASAFTYVAAPTIASILPISGPTSGNTAITITGANFTGATSVKVNGVAATSVVVVSATSITARTPAGTVGTKSVSVTTVVGTATKTSCYTYTASLAGDEITGGNNSGGGVVAGKVNKASDTTAGQLGTNVAEETVAAAPMGVQLYLQTIITQPDADVDCVKTQSADADAPAGTVAAIDLDHNGEADICQLRGGDLDLNGVIDDSDMGILLDMIGVEPLHGIGDMDANGVIDSADMGLLLLKVK